MAGTDAVRYRGGHSTVMPPHDILPIGIKSLRPMKMFMKNANVSNSEQSAVEGQVETISISLLGRSSQSRHGIPLDSQLTGVVLSQC